MCPLTQAQVLLEVTGHYHRALLQYLQELAIPVFVIQVQKRQEGLLKSDKRDALGLANQLYNQLEKGIQKVIGRLAGQMTSVIYTLLKQDQKLLAHLSPGVNPPSPAIYDPELHRRHRMGRYQPSRSGAKSPQLIQPPPL